MNKHLYLLIVVMFSFGCSENNTNQKGIIEIDKEKAKTYILDEIARDVKVLPLLSDTLLMGNITNIKNYGEYIFIFDEGLQQIHAYTKEFDYISTLNKIGRGHGEYLEFFTFAYDKNTNNITIFERYSGSFMNYQMPDFEFVGAEQADEYYMAMEYLPDGELFAVKESSRENPLYGALQILNKAKDSVLHSYEIDDLSVEFSQDKHITIKPDGSILYICPGYQNTILKVTKTGIDTLGSIDFKNDNFPQKFWEMTLNNNKDLLIDYVEEYNPFLAPHYGVLCNDTLKFSCQIFTSLYPEEGATNVPSMLFVRNDKGEDILISALELKNINNVKLTAIGTVNGYYISVLYPEEIEANPTDSKISKQVMDIAKTNPNTPILILYKF